MFPSLSEFGIIFAMITIQYVIPAALFLLALYFVIRKAVRDALRAGGEDR